MKTKLFIVIAAALCALALLARAQDLDAAPPVVVRTVPEAGANDVAPGDVEIRVTFSKAMKDQTWSWTTAWQNSDAKALGKPRYESDQKTCVLKVKLEPGRTYGYWINSQKFTNFKDTQGHAAVPYLLTFRTRAQ